MERWKEGGKRVVEVRFLSFASWAHLEGLESEQELRGEERAVERKGETGFD